MFRYSFIFLTFQGKQKTSRRLIKLKAKVILDPDEKFTKISCGKEFGLLELYKGSVHSLALTTNGRVFSWGYNINTSTIGSNAEDNIKLLQQANPQYEVSGQLGRGKGLVNLPGEIINKTFAGTVSDISAGLLSCVSY